MKKTSNMSEAEKYIRDVLKYEPDYRHYAKDVKGLLRAVAKLRNELYRKNK